MLRANKCSLRKHGWVYKKSSKNIMVTPFGVFFFRVTSCVVSHRDIHLFRVTFKRKVIKSFNGM